MVKLVALVAICASLVFWFKLAPTPSPVLAQSDPVATPVAEEEAPTSGVVDEPSLSDPIAQQALLNPPPTVSDLPVGITEVPCDIGAPIGPDKVEGETYYCGIFTVPQFWDDPDAGNIDLRFVVANATGDDPAPDPLFYIAGGPGQSSIATSLDAYSQIRPGRDIVRLDQRGTGLSQRLGLEECLVLAFSDEEASDELGMLIQAISAPEAENEPGDDPGADASEVDESSAQPSLLPSRDVNTTINALCARKFTGTGIDLNAFTTVQSARDIIELVKMLGYESFNLHGVSYGSRLAMTVIADLDTVEDAAQRGSGLAVSALHLLALVAAQQSARSGAAALRGM